MSNFNIWHWDVYIYASKIEDIGNYWTILLCNGNMLLISSRFPMLNMRYLIRIDILYHACIKVNSFKGYLKDSTCIGMSNVRRIHIKFG